MIRQLFGGWRWLMTLLVFVAVAVMCSLGVWQFNRLNERLALNERIDARLADAPVAFPAQPDAETLEYRRVRLTGTFLPDQQVLLRNRTYNDATGYHVLTPFRITETGQTLLIDRGWVPLTMSDRAQWGNFAPPAGEVALTGVVMKSQQPYRGGPQDPPFSAERPRLDAWFYVTTERIAQQSGLDLLPVYVQIQRTASNSGQQLPVPGRVTDLGPGNHLSYVVQWFSFALIALGGYLVLMYQQVHRPQLRIPSRRADGEVTPT